LPSLLRFKALSPAEKVLAAYAFTQIQSLDRPAHPELDSISLEDWLRARRQSKHAIRSLWNLVLQPTMKDDVSRVSADLGLMVFQEGFLRSRTGANVGWAKMGLSRLLEDAARRYIEERGGEIRLGRGMDGLEVDDGRACFVDGAELHQDACRRCRRSYRRCFHTLRGTFSRGGRLTRLHRERICGTTARSGTAISPPS
jgi:hypothetical protein